MGDHDAYSDEDYRRQRDDEIMMLRNGLVRFIERCDDVNHLRMLRKAAQNIDDLYAGYRLLNALIR